VGVVVAVDADPRGIRQRDEIAISRRAFLAEGDGIQVVFAQHSLVHVEFIVAVLILIVLRSKLPLRRPAATQAATLRLVPGQDDDLSSMSGLGRGDLLDQLTEDCQVLQLQLGGGTVVELMAERGHRRYGGIDGPAHMTPARFTLGLRLKASFLAGHGDHDGVLDAVDREMAEMTTALQPDGA